MSVKKQSKLKPRWPRPYLSWSQFQVWKFKGEEEFAKVYIYGEGKTNPAMQLGKQVADMVFADEEQGDPILEHLRIFLPHSEHTEFEVPRLKGDNKRCGCAKCKARGIENPLMFNGVPLYGILDGWTDKGFAANEKKTAKSRQYEEVWRAQLKFYTLLLHLYFKIRPEQVDWTISWMPTEWETGNIVQPTGDIENIKVKIGAGDLPRIGAELPLVWREIGQFCANQFRSLGL